MKKLSQLSVSVETVLYLRLFNQSGKKLLITILEAHV